MFSMEFIDKWNLKKLATSLSLKNWGYQLVVPFAEAELGPRW